MNRRTFLLATAAFGFAASPFAAEAEPLKELRIGYQKTSVLLVVKAQKVLEERFEPQGVTVRWVEFPFGPPLLEALNVGAIDYGYTGNAPPIFAQAAHANIQYVGVIPARGYGQAIVVPDASTLKTLADLRGKKIGVAKGSSAHDLLVAALESASISWQEITPVYLAPADAAAAFARGAIDAWSIWDPFYAIAELKLKARSLPIDPKVAKQNSFFLANSDFIAQHADVVTAINAEVAKATQWAGDHRDETATLFSEASGVEIEAQKKSVARSEFTFGPIDDKIIAEQQAVADRFRRLDLIPTAVAVRDIVWIKKPNS
ncbi:MAG: aliphatic sulfonate ABC transporter substrate-binding protein [Xanthobacteraceae bacterium]|jgi:aliphatic sulfonates family ABC transporter substrate-binding protein